MCFNALQREKTDFCSRCWSNVSAYLSFFDVNVLVEAIFNHLQTHVSLQLEKQLFQTEKDRKWVKCRPLKAAVAQSGDCALNMNASDFTFHMQELLSFPFPQNVLLALATYST